jgi:uncharacterized protein (DUF58 family)
MGLMPIIFLLSGLVLIQPSKPKELDIVEKQNHYLGDIIDLKRDIQVTDGLGPVVIGEKIPSHFELVEGNNVALFWKGLSPISKSLNYKIRCTKRGIYTLSNVQWETKHPISLVPTKLGELDIDQTLIVQTYPIQVKKIRQQKLFSKIPMPSEAQIKIGIPTTDFKEIREYSFGDSYKNINWKATSRKAHLRKPPMVNEFEMEGMKIVWLFLNTSKPMALGTSISNSLEYAIQAIMGLTQFYLGRNCRVGVSLYDDEKAYKTLSWHSDKSRPIRMIEDTLLTQAAPSYKTLYSGDFIIPDTGKKQLYQVTSKMLETEISKGLYNLKQSVINCRGHIIGGNPLFYIVTSVTKQNIKSLEEGIKELRRYSKATRHHSPSIILIHITSYKVKAKGETENYAAEILEIERIPLLRRLRRKGVMVVKWDPTKHRFRDVLLSQVRRR